VARKKILIVEDETITALHLRQHLSRLGYQVSAAATSGEEAVLLAEQLNPDLVLMDVKLAGKMDGVEASQRIQEKRSVPVIYLTSYPNVFLSGFGRMQEPGICLSKPFSSPVLEQTIEIALGGAHRSSARD
jgi:CheY-like chemotaxis protein